MVGFPMASVPLVGFIKGLGNDFCIAMRVTWFRLAY